jgi:hypothetical protein
MTPVGVCDRCRRRGTSCIDQTLPDSSTRRPSQEERLSRAEALLERLIGKHGLEDFGSSLRQDPTNPLPNLSVGVAPSSERTPRQERATFIPSKEPPSSRDAALASQLLAAWPSPPNLDVLSKVCVSQPCLLTCCIFMSKETPSLQDVLRRPDQTFPPVIIARRLLMLAKWLQGISRESIEELKKHGLDHFEIITRAFQAARSVTCDDNLACSLEGVECIIFEALFSCDAGNLRQSLIAIRRGILLSELISLDDNDLGFHLLHLDRFLSLMLGLRPGSLRANFATPEALDGCSPIECLQRVDCEAAGLILHRNANERHDIGVTAEIDRLLQRGASYMSARWWLPPFFGGSDPEEDLKYESHRFLSQLTHFHLLARLHLPFILQNDEGTHYNRITAVTANREILIRTIAFLNHNGHGHSSIVLLVFVACTTLCVVHLSGSRSHQMAQVQNMLAHQRPSDRGWMEKALDMLDIVFLDAKSRQICSIVRHLLRIEADIAGGRQYGTVSTPPIETSRECSGNVTREGEGVQIHIPHFGTISIERQAKPSDFFGATSASPIALEWDSWAIDGVDIALFDGLLQGSSSLFSNEVVTS